MIEDELQDFRNSVLRIWRSLVNAQRVQDRLWYVRLVSILILWHLNSS